jgi:hypothetical protein
MPVLTIEQVRHLLLGYYGCGGAPHVDEDEEEDEQDSLRKTLAASSSCFDFWSHSPRGDWLLWIAARIGVDQEAKCQRVLRAAVECARLARPLGPVGDERPWRALECVDAWASGGATLQELRDAKSGVDASYKLVAAGYDEYVDASLGAQTSHYDEDDAAADARDGYFQGELDALAFSPQRPAVNAARSLVCAVEEYVDANEVDPLDAAAVARAAGDTARAWGYAAYDAAYAAAHRARRGFLKRLSGAARAEDRAAARLAEFGERGMKLATCAERVRAHVPWELISDAPSFDL